MNTARNSVSVDAAGTWLVLGDTNTLFVEDFRLLVGAIPTAGGTCPTGAVGLNFARTSQTVTLTLEDAPGWDEVMTAISRIVIAPIIEDTLAIIRWAEPPWWRRYAPVPSRHRLDLTLLRKPRARRTGKASAADRRRWKRRRFVQALRRARG